MLAVNRIKSPLHGSHEQIPSENCKEYYLFLLELFVKQASGDRLAKLNEMFCVPTIVHFEFFNLVDDDDLTVTSVDSLFRPQADVVDGIQIFNAGKSVLFAVDHDAVMNRAVKMILNITVKKRMPDGIKPDVSVGAGKLDLSDRYAALRIEMLQCWRKGVTTSKVFDGQVPLIHNGNLSGNLDIFLRMSGFGQTIATELDASPIMRDSSTFIFGGGEIDRSLWYKCRKVDSRTVDLFEGSCEYLQSPVNCPVCMPERYPCKPCDQSAAVYESYKKMRNEGDGEIAERELKVPSSKGFIQSSCLGPPQSCGKPVILKVSGLFDNGDGISGKKPTVTVAAESTATKPPSDPSDVDHDIFVLRIGKKGLVGVDDKSDIQLEMKTPKGPERRAPIRYETRDMQTDIEEEPPKEMKKKKKKK